MSTTGNEIWEAFSKAAGNLAENTGKAVVAVDAGHRVAASGVHWKDGVVVTASHLVRRAEEVNVIMPDGSSVRGPLRGRDSTTDLAVVRIDDSSALATLRLTATANVGELVLAVARSRRGELSASAGIMARTGGPWQTWRGGQINRLLRPDVRLYPGQSGSALVNGRGELVGINSSVLARESVITLPTETVERVVSELLERGHVAQPYLGIAMQEVSLPQEWRSRADQEHGLLVLHVAPDTPAKQSGINLGDVIVRIDSQPVSNVRQFHRLLLQKQIGETLDLGLIRGGSTIETKVMLGDRPRH